MFNIRNARLLFTLFAGMSATAALTGCADTVFSNTSLAPQSLDGNWELSSTAAVAGPLPYLRGALNGTSAAITGILHTDDLSTCVAPHTTIAISGHVQTGNVVQLTGSLAGGTLVVNGTLADDGHSMSDANYVVTGGPCSFGGPAVATVQQYAPLTGNYAGSFKGVDGSAMTVTSSLQQRAMTDGSGNFVLSGSAAMPANSCFPALLPVSSSVVTGKTFTVTYADAAKTNVVAASGTLSTDGTTMNISFWQFTGQCSVNDGNGELSRQ